MCNSAVVKSMKGTLLEFVDPPSSLPFFLFFSCTNNNCALMVEVRVMKQIFMYPLSITGIGAHFRLIVLLADTFFHENNTI